MPRRIASRPRRCIDPTNDNRGIRSFDLTDAEWKALEELNRRERRLWMRCCEAKVASASGQDHALRTQRPTAWMPRCPRG